MTADDANRLLALVLDCSRGVRSPLELMDAVRALGHTVSLHGHPHDNMPADEFSQPWTCAIDLLVGRHDDEVLGGGADAAAAVRSAVCKLVQFCRPATAPA